jgi:predicted ATPase
MAMNTMTTVVMVLMFDDLRWADISSLQVIDYLISDTLNPRPLMIIGSYRSNEVDKSHMLSSVMQKLVDKQ